MSTLTRRLAKIERFLTDSTGLVPHSPAWMDHWTAVLKRKLAGEPTPKIPMEVFRAYYQRRRKEIQDARDLSSAGSGIANGRSES